MRACEKCDLWNRTSDHMGECRGAPPAVLAGMGTVFPTTRFDSWCGAFVDKVDEEGKPHPRPSRRRAATVEAPAAT